MVRGRRSVLGLVLVFAVACGGDESASSGSPSPTTAAPAVTGTSAAAPSKTVVPDAVMRDVGTGADVNLRALGLPDRPTLYWFWAPH